MTKKAYLFDQLAALFRPLSGGATYPYVQPPPPNPPTGVTNTNVVSDGWTTTWTAPTTGFTPIGYRVYVGGVQVGTDVLADTGVLTLGVGGEAAGTYTVTVRSFNRWGESVDSTSATVTVTGTSGGPNPPTGVTATAVTDNGWTTTWVAPASGPAPTGYRVLVNGAVYGSVLPSTARTLDVTAEPAGTYTVAVRAFNSLGSAVSSSVTVVVSAGSAPPGLFPNRVIAGWYSSKQSHNNTPDHAAVIMNPANDSIAPGAWWQTSGDHAHTIPSGLVPKQTPAFKEFNSDGFITNAELLANLADADAAGYYLVQTTKVPIAPGGRSVDANNNAVNDHDWLGIANGNYDSQLNGYATIALNRANASPPKRGFFLTFHHEPHGDYTTSLSTLPTPTATPATWAAMQTYCSYYMAGKTSGANKGTASGTYTSSTDTRRNLSWGCIPNGFLFTGSAAEKIEVTNLMPSTLIDAFNTNHGIISADIYDGSAAGNRVYAKIDVIAQWCRDRNVKYAGIAETGCYDLDTITKLWEAVKRNSDMYRYVIYWDSGIGHVPGGATDWRLLPNGYPADSLAPPLDSNGVGAKGPFVGPGTSITQDLLLYWRDTAVIESEAMPQ